MLRSPIEDLLEALKPLETTAFWFYQNKQPAEIPGDKEKLADEDETAPLKYTPFVMLPPAFCDFLASSIMNVGLILTSASSYQMLRGSNLIFVGILTVLVLKRRLEWYRWFGMAIILSGLIVVGVSDFLLVGVFFH